MTNDNDGISAYQTRVVTVEEFRSSAEVWNQLVFSMAQPSVFLTWEWIYTWWEHFQTGKRELLVLFVEHRGTLKGVLPLFREGGHTTKSVRFCTADDLYPDHLDIIAAPEDANACLASIYEFMFQAGSRWTLIEFPMVTLDSAVYGWLSAKTAKGERSPYVEVACPSVANYIPLEGDFDSYFSSLDKKHRYNVRSRRKRLYDELGARYTVSVPNSDGLTVLCDLHRRRANRKGIVSSFDQDRVLAFHRAFVERATPKGWVQFRFLESAQGPIAAAYNLVLDGRVYSYQKGIDPVWERHGPGAVLLYELIQEAFAHKLKEYNFLQGAEAYKQGWTPFWRNLYALKLHHRRLPGRLTALARTSRHLLRRLGRLREGNA